MSDYKYYEDCDYDVAVNVPTINVNKEYVKVKKNELLNLIGAAADARSLLDAVHCYDTPQYEALGKVVRITWEAVD